MENKFIKEYLGYCVKFDEQQSEICLMGLSYGGKQLKLLQLPVTQTLYDLIYSIVDSIIMRTLQNNFSFESDKIAFYLREAFACLVPKIYPIEAEHKKSLNKKTNQFDVENFDLIKRFLDAGKGGSSSEGKGKNERMAGKCRFLGITNQALNILTHYESDDSDEECDIAQKDPGFSKLQIQAGIQDFYKNPSAKKNHYQFIPHELSPAAQSDLVIIQQALQESMLSVNKSLKFDLTGHLIYQNKKINTLFVVPGFRGINHMQRFSDEVRRVRRSDDFQKNLVKKPYFSESVLMENFDFYRDQKISSTLWHNKELLASLEKDAEFLQKQLISLKDKDYILVRNLSAGKTHIFSNLLHAIQHIYSNGIFKLQRSQRFLLTNKQIDLQLFNAYNPFISESETPYHAMRYACGLKSVYEPMARRPFYHSDGKPSFPYIGEVCISLRPLAAVVSKNERQVLRQLTGQTQIKPSFEIAPELEASGVGCLPADEIFYSEVIKCPNFRGAYKASFATKFGLSKSLFEQFKTAIVNAEDIEQRNLVEYQLLEWLCHYQSIVLMEKATAIAKQNGCELVFKTGTGNLSAEIPHRDAVNIDTNRQMMLKNLAENIYKKISDQQILFKEKLTSAYTAFYAVTEAEVKKTLENLGYPSEKIKKFIQEEDSLRRGLMADKTPRSSFRESSTAVTATLINKFSEVFPQVGIIAKQGISNDEGYSRAKSLR